MKILAFVLIIFSLSKLFIAGSQDKHEMSLDLFYQIKNNIEGFQRKAFALLVVDGIVGLICGFLIFLS